MDGDLGQQIVAILRPDSLSDIFIYAMFFLSLITTAIIPEKNVQAPYMMYGVLLFCIIDLLRGRDGSGLSSMGTFYVGGESIFSDTGLVTFTIHIGMFVFPMIAAGLIRQQGRKGGAAIPLSILIGLIGGMYAIMSFVAPEAVYGKIF